MNWSKVIADVKRHGNIGDVVENTIGEMQSMIDFVKDIEPELYWEFERAVKKAAYNSANYNFGL